MSTKNILISIVVIAVSCSEAQEEIDFSNVQQWKLGWRMIASSTWNKDYQLAEAQFDSLLALNDTIDSKFLIIGLQSLHELGKKEKMVAILQELDANELQEICQDNLFIRELEEVRLCENTEPEEVKNTDLQMELVKMYVDDQVARGNVLESLMDKYDLNNDEVTHEGVVTVDSKNRNRLKEIFQKYGFPTKEITASLHYIASRLLTKRKLKWSNE